MRAKKIILDRMIKAGFSTSGHTYFWFLENFTENDLLIMELNFLNKY